MKAARANGGGHLSLTILNARFVRRQINMSFLQPNLIEALVNLLIHFCLGPNLVGLGQTVSSTMPRHRPANAAKVPFLQTLCSAASEKTVIRHGTSRAWIWRGRCSERSRLTEDLPSKEISASCCRLPQQHFLKQDQ